MAQVKLILREDVPTLGHAGDVVSVKPGYAWNYLIPQGKGIPATEGRIREVGHHKRVVAEKVAHELKHLSVLGDRIQSLKLEVRVKAGETGTLFGSVTTPQIAELLAQKGIEVDRRKIDLGEPIKELGEHSVPIRLHREVIASLKLKVVADE